MDEEAILNIYAEAKANNWAYPQLFEALKKFGVDRYEVDVRTCETKYAVGKESVVHPAPVGFKIPTEFGAFDPVAFKVALTRSQLGETNYEQFINEIAKAGIVFYRVDMKPRSVTYHGEDRRKKIIEPVPPLPS